MVKPDELGREGLAHKIQRITSEKIQKRSTLFQAMVGVSMLAVAGAAGLAAYTHYTNTVYSPAYTEQYQKQVEIARQEKLADQQAKDSAQAREIAKKAADEAIERARVEAQAAKKEAETAARKTAEEAKPNELLDKMFQRTSMIDVICMPRDLQLTANFNGKGEVTSFNKTYSLNLGDKVGTSAFQEALKECKTNFADVDFSAPRSLGQVPGIAHYAQLKDMWALCRGGFENPGTAIKISSDGSASGYYQLYASRYNFSSVEDYQGYQACMKNALTDPFIATGGTTPVAGLQP